MKVERRTGRLRGAVYRPSPFCDRRPLGIDLSLLVIHGISLPAGQFTGNWVERLFLGRLVTGVPSELADLEGVRVSAHLFIRRCGKVIQFVSFRHRAWHAGVSEFQGRTQCNDFSIGVELEGTDTVPYTASQYERLVTISRLLMHAYPAITPDRIVGHCDIAPGRKTDPGDSFDWQRLRDGSGSLIGSAGQL
ncbi:MAG: 1,6-anhydro-N-acetylmuramyl-L-alanine amidase AmpD [Pseudomonadota bacterium]|nr:1,6-anhydro-N-acetylmuramyl-L-alanine amidase AmpD [Pseudomonadota bacterium]